MAKIWNEVCKMESKRLKVLLERPFSDRVESGMTIIEILIVIALMAGIMAVLVTKLLDRNEEAKTDLTSIALGQLSDDLKIYKLNNNHFPTTEEGLQALVEAPASATRTWKGPYIDPEKINDPWGKPLQYELVNFKNFKITSAGADGEFETSDDVMYPKESEKKKEEAPVTAELKVPEGNLDKSAN